MSNGGAGGERRGGGGGGGGEGGEEDATSSSPVVVYGGKPIGLGVSGDLFLERNEGFVCLTGRRGRVLLESGEENDSFRGAERAVPFVLEKKKSERGGSKFES